MKIVVIGSGVAGLTAAIAAARDGHEVTVVAKSRLSESNTRYAQGGVAVVTDPSDSVEAHIADTMAAGHGLSDPQAVRVLCSRGPEAVFAMVDSGVNFDRIDGEFVRGLEAAHSHARIVHAGGDATGAAIAFGLLERIRQLGLTTMENTTVVDVVVEDSRVCGVELLDGGRLPADAVILATGGAGQLFGHTTNPSVATADGVAMALRAGAVVSDMEFYQFHPTALATPGSHLVSEAVRGEGAVLLDDEGRRFMLDVHPDAELAPRDVVARAIAVQMAAQDGRPVLLDATALGAEFLARRFPTIDTAVREQGFDWSREAIPVSPAAHYFMGGVRTDTWGRTNVPGLYAVGEVACTGLHGANRLASNSLLEGAVFGLRAARAVNEPNAVEPFDDSWAEPHVLPAVQGGEAFTRADLQHLMWDSVGVSRDAEGLATALKTVEQWASPEITDVKAVEDANLLLVARAVITAALARRSSRGAHTRLDYPTSDPQLARHFSYVREESC